jgi:hypothetical protein
MPFSYSKLLFVLPCSALFSLFLLLRYFHLIFSDADTDTPNRLRIWWLLLRFLEQTSSQFSIFSLFSRFFIKWRAKVLLALQPLLRREIDFILSSLPSIGLYGPQPDLQQFRHFLEHVRNCLRAGPRSTLLRQLNQKCYEKFCHNKDVQLMYNLMGLSENAQFIELLRRFSEVNAGRLHQLYLKTDAIAQSQLTVEKLQEIEDGIRKKLCLQDSQDLEVQKKLQQVILKHQERMNKAITEAKELLLRLQNDSQYQRYQKIHQVWQEEEFSLMEEEWEMTNRSLGDSRHRLGCGFEDSNFDLLFSMVCLQEGFENSSLISYIPLRGGIWRDREKQKLGEIDLIVIKMRKNENLSFDKSNPSQSFYSSEVAALVELKTNCFELGCGYLQHMRFYTRNDIHVFDSTTHTEITFNSQSPPPLYLVTLIPKNTYKISAPPTLSENYAQLFQMKGKPIPNEILQQMSDRIRSKPEMQIGPTQLLESNLRQRIFVI